MENTKSIPDKEQGEWSLLIKQGEEFDAPSCDTPLLRFKWFQNVTDIRTIATNRRVGYYHRQITRAEADAYAYGYIAGHKEGHAAGEVAQSHLIAQKIGLKMQ